MQWTVFYAWQSDLPNSTNRGFIEKALEAAVADLGAEGSVVQVDRDTSGVPGSPDIEHTIFDKIAAAAVFVCDVSIITAKRAPRPTSNPNVLVELGFALRALGSARVLMVMNTHFGRPELLPFDIRRKRVIAYQAAPGDDKTNARAGLRRIMTDAIRSSLTAAQRDRAPAPTSPALSLVEALKTDSSDQRARAEAYSAAFIERVDALKPGDPRSDDHLVAAIQSTAHEMAEFHTVAAALAVHSASATRPEFIRLLEQMMERYTPPRGRSVTYQETDFDFARFIGHEMLVGLTAAYIREQKWSELNDLLSATFFVQRPGGDLHVGYGRLCEPTDLLDRVRASRLTDGRTTRVSIRADILAERYQSEPLSSRTSWDRFMEADLLLYLRRILRARAGQADGQYWHPWTAPHLQELPVMVRRSVSKFHAQCLAQVLGVSYGPTFGTELGTAFKELTRQYWRAASWHLGEDFEWNLVGSR